MMGLQLMLAGWLAGWRLTENILLFVFHMSYICLWGGDQPLSVYIQNYIYPGGTLSPTFHHALIYSKS